jgi:hypothetical protein
MTNSLWFSESKPFPESITADALRWPEPSQGGQKPERHRVETGSSCGQRKDGIRPPKPSKAAEMELFKYSQGLTMKHWWKKYRD